MTGDLAPLAFRSRPLVGAILCLGAAALGVAGSFAELLSVEYRFDNQRFAYTTTSWTTRTDTPELDPQSLAETTAPNGVPVVVAAVVLLVAAALGWYAARAGAGRIGRVSGPVAAIGATFLAASVATIGMQEIGWLGIARSDRDEGSGTSVVVAVGGGFWVLVAAAGLAIVAAVFAWRAPRAGDVREEPETPRLGIPIVHRLPDG